MSSILLDLLRERRQALGVPSLLETLADRRRLLLQSSLIGALVLAGAMLLTAGVFLQDSIVAGEIKRLQTSDDEARAMEERLERLKREISSSSRTNTLVVKALTRLRTSSALMAELQQRTPRGLQLVEARTLGDKLVLQGRTLDPLGFARINALQLDLQRSQLLEAEGLTLNKVERQVKRRRGSKAQGQTSERQAYISFELEGPFATLSANDQLRLMRQLGSEGMARRLELLRQEGLL